MSTRSHILIEGLKPMLYRHCDGYPGKADGSEYGVLPDLLPFLTSFMEGRGWDPEYMLARMAQHLTNGHGEGDFTGYGIDTGMHGDEEFVYLVKCNRSVEVRTTTRAFWDTPTIENTTVIETHPF